MSVTKEHYDEFNNFRQGNLSVTKAVMRFNQLKHLCPHMVPNEEERLRRMIRMLRPEITVIVDSGTAPPTTTAEYVKTVETSEIKVGFKEVSGTITRGRRIFPIRGTITTIKEEVNQLSKLRTFHLVLSVESYILGSAVWAQIYVKFADARVTYPRIVQTRCTSPSIKVSRVIHRLSSKAYKPLLMGLVFPKDYLWPLFSPSMPEFSL
ncbi:hypothetical protein TIFTF001_021054 [Ficus carica]|uniref:Retrotransposon gag domain-containing protein n=1 Tax=Ficus carica TaxID=3494 RepID=A0AA88DE79_FICCA|nr:hypothetical protein TIFTF001_021054 [Ficus carica]